MKRTILFILLALVLGVGGIVYLLGGDAEKAYTGPETLNPGESMVVALEVGPEKVACEGVVEQECLVVDGELFYDEIKGFDYNEGATYFIQVKMTKLENVPADSSEFEYTFIEELYRE